MKAKDKKLDFLNKVAVSTDFLFFNFLFSFETFFRITSRSTIFYIGKITKDEDDDDDLSFAFE